MGYYPDRMELHVYLPTEGGTGESMVQEDDGLTDGHQAGGYFRTSFRLVRETNAFQINGQVEGRGFPEFRRKAFHLFLHTPPGEQWMLDGFSQLPTGAWEIPNPGRDFQLQGRRLN
jgi:alpha-glucosidase